MLPPNAREGLVTMFLAVGKNRQIDQVDSHFRNLIGK